MQLTDAHIAELIKVAHGMRTGSLSQAQKELVDLYLDNYVAWGSTSIADLSKVLTKKGKEALETYTRLGSTDPSKDA